MFKRNRKRFLLPLPCCLGVLTLARFLAGAQDASTTTSDATNAPVGLPPIDVVARKAPAPAQSVPLSVTPVPYSTIREDDIHLVKDAELFAPNVFLNEFSARKLSNPYVRGIGSSPNNPGVTTYVDGVPQLNANSSSIELIDVGQIEFVRGPQGALFGRNTLGGVISISSRAPSEDFRAEIQGEYGNYDFRDVRLSLSGPIIPNLLDGSVAAGYSARDGYTRNDVTGHRLDSRDAFFGKIQALWLGSDQWKFRFILSGEHAHDGDYALGDLAAIRAYPHHVSHDFEGFTHREIVAPTFIATHESSAVDLSLVTGLVWWRTHDATDLDYSPIPAVTRDNLERDFQFTEELRLSSPRDLPLRLSENLQLNWQAGLTIFDQNYEQDAVNSYSPGILYFPNEFGPGIPPVASPANSQHSPRAELDDYGIGAYVQAGLLAWEKLELSAGLHGDYEKKDASANSFFTTPDPFLPPPIKLRASRDFSEISPQASLSWHILPPDTLYVSVGRGYKAGGFNPVSPSATTEAYGEEHSWNYETGLKTSWFDNRLAINLCAFYIDWQDLQLNLPAGPGQFYIANAGSADSKGVELEIRARPCKGLDLFASAGYADARFLTGARAGHIDSLGAITDVDVSGKHLIYTPDYTASAGAQYSWAICSHATVYARGEVDVLGRYFYNPVNSASQSAYSLASFRVGLRTGRWFAEAWIRNAFDSHYVPIAFEFPNGSFGGSGFVGESGAPQTYGVRAGFTF